MHVSASARPERLVRILALTGGLFWIVKVLLIWENGGTDRYGGAVGLTFLIGTILLASATVLWTWTATRGRSLLVRTAVLLGALVALLAAVNLPTLVAHSLLPGSWLAGEFGVILVAVAAILTAFVVSGPRTISTRV